MVKESSDKLNLTVSNDQLTSSKCQQQANDQKTSKQMPRHYTV